MTERLTGEQLAAVRPSRSAWIAANAGSGKTRVLTHRVARCLLDGVRPDRLLCLTYTRAAAGEMKTRLFRTLGHWAMCPDARLREELRGLLEPDEPADLPPARLAAARRLFARALEYPGGLRIQTIHSFGFALLRRFPREAGLHPGATILDQREVAVLAERAFEDTLRAARSGREPSLHAAYGTLLAVVGGGGFEALRQTFLDQRDAYLAFAARHEGEARDRAIRGWLEAEPGEAAAAAERARSRLAGARAELGQLAEILRTEGGNTAQDRAPKLVEAVQDLRGRDMDRAIRQLRAALLSQQGTLHRHVFTRSVRQALRQAGLEDLPDVLERALEQIEQARRITVVAGASAAAVRLGLDFLARNEQARADRSGLDFDDVITHVGRLLQRSEARDWVRYRLDGGLDHILVDEAQDTSPAQWEALRQLAEAFFTDTEHRTVFAVGDEKQSIYSFQGAEPESFAASRDWFDARLREQGGGLHVGALQTSFRSSPVILRFVDSVFCRENYHDDGKAAAEPEGEREEAGELAREHSVPWAETLVGYAEPLAHRSFHAGRAGRVEVWDLFDARSAEPESGESVLNLRPEKVVARRVAARISSWMEQKTLLPGAGRPVRPEDILVLVQRRGVFTDELVRCLRLRRVPVAGADRIRLTQHLAVQDLLALLAFSLLPEDDFTLAILLRSPFCDLSEEDLFRLAWDRGDRRLWDRLRAAAESPETGAARFRAARDFLADMRQAADRLGPYEFLERALVVHGGRKRLLARLGEDAMEPIDALLAEAIAFEAAGPASLEEFLWRVRSGTTEVKAETSIGPAAVRIMTVHGAKGLEAPVVIIPDANRVPAFASRTRALVGEDGSGGPIPLLVPQSGDHTERTGRLLAAEKRREREESYRLFYVALTRAENWLIVGGSRWLRPSGRGAGETCWQFRAEAAARRIGERISPQEDGERLAAALGTVYAGHVVEGAGGSGPGPVAALGGAEAAPEMPDWIDRPAAPETWRSRWIAASGLDPDPAPAGGEDPTALDQGNLTHLLLERLAGLPAGADRDHLARALADRFRESLADPAREEVLRQALRILDHPELGRLFRGEGLAEAWVALRTTSRTGGVWGRIDRLVLGAERVLIVDFKGDPEPPEVADRVARRYLAQLGAYRRAVAAIYPERTVAAAILWTRADPPRLLELPDRLAEAALAECGLPPEPMAAEPG